MMLQVQILGVVDWGIPKRMEGLPKSAWWFFTPSSFCDKIRWKFTKTHHGFCFFDFRVFRSILWGKFCKVAMHLRAASIANGVELKMYFKKIIQFKLIHCPLLYQFLSRSTFGDSYRCNICALQPPLDWPLEKIKQYACLYSSAFL